MTSSCWVVEKLLKTRHNLKIYLFCTQIEYKYTHWYFYSICSDDRFMYSLFFVNYYALIFLLIDLQSWYISFLYFLWQIRLFIFKNARKHHFLTFYGHVGRVTIFTKLTEFKVQQKKDFHFSRFSRVFKLFGKSLKYFKRC